MYRVGIFIPIYFREEAVKKCLLSLLRTNFNQLEVFLCLGINGATEMFKNDFLTDYVREHDKNTFESVRIFNFGRNIGKPKIINEMTNRCKPFDFLVSIDSDMVTVDSKWLVNFLKIFHDWPDTNSSYPPLGALCANQQGHNVHLVKEMESKFSVTCGEFTLWSTPRNDGVAGGVLITPVNVWKELRGYNAHNIYASDDGHYCQDCDSHGKAMAYVEEIFFYHPMEPDKEYGKWKYRAARNKLDKEERNGFFEHMRIQ